MTHKLNDPRFDIDQQRRREKRSEQEAQGSLSVLRRVGLEKWDYLATRLKLLVAINQAWGQNTAELRSQNYSNFTVRARPRRLGALPFSIVNRFRVAVLHGRVGRLKAKNGGFRLGQEPQLPKFIRDPESNFSTVCNPNPDVNQWDL
jgi:hypothetical protein